MLLLHTLYPVNDLKLHTGSLIITHFLPVTLNTLIHTHGSYFQRKIIMLYGHIQ